MTCLIGRKIIKRIYLFSKEYQLTGNFKAKTSEPTKSVRQKRNICVFLVSRPYLGFCFDSKHFIVNCEQNIVKFFSELKSEKTHIFIFGLMAQEEHTHGTTACMRLLEIIFSRN